MIYDCFPFYNELDLLEMRFNILDREVNYFVIGESVETFSGKEKPLYLKENMERFKQWEKRIIRVEIDKTDTKDPFERAFNQKDALRKTLIQLKIDDSDIVYYGDVDEIWKPQKIVDDKVYNLEQLNYCYYLDQRSSERWVGTIVGKWGTVKTNNFAHWRAHHDNELSNGGFHFTNLGGEKQLLSKLEAYDHQEYNNLTNKTLLVDRIKDGEDYVGREVDWEGKPFKFSLDESQLPEYIKSNKEKYVAYFKS